MNNITWRRATRLVSAPLVGRVGKISLFEIEYDRTRMRNDPNKYKLYTRLPIKIDTTVRYPTEAIAQYNAEVLLQTFLTQLSAELKPKKAKAA